MSTPRHVCTFCGSWAADQPNALWCRVCVALAACEQCGGARRAPPDIGLCDRCRRLNAIDVRQLFVAAAAVAALDLEHLMSAPVVYPYRTPLTSLEAARLARAARELAAAALELVGAPTLRDAPRKPPQRALRAPAATSSQTRRRGRR